MDGLFPLIMLIIAHHGGASSTRLLAVGFIQIQCPHLPDGHALRQGALGKALARPLLAHFVASRLLASSRLLAQHVRHFVCILLIMCLVVLYIYTMINLITSFYISRFNSELNNDRNDELQQCLKNNLENEFIEKIHLYVDDDEAVDCIKNMNNNAKINIISVGFKPLYSDLFSYALNHLQNKTCMIANSDIYLHDHDLDARLLSILNDNATVFALTRHEHDFTSPMMDDFCGSHDCFIFKSPLNFHDRIENIKHVQHHWGSENIVLHELSKNNIKLYNPCHQIKIVHLHKSGLREENRPRINYGHNINPRNHATLSPIVFKFQ